MAKFRKTAIVEAEQFDEDMSHPVVCVALKDVATGAIVGTSAPFSQITRAVYAIKTLEGWHEVAPVDWIIQGIRGEFWPCKPDIFAETYEAVEQ
jgi:hypothetical protein